MAKIVIVIEDKGDDAVDVRFTSDAHLPDEFANYTKGQILACALHDAVAFAMEGK